MPLHSDNLEHFDDIVNHSAFVPLPQHIPCHWRDIPCSNIYDNMTDGTVSHEKGAPARLVSRNNWIDARSTNGRSSIGKSAKESGKLNVHDWVETEGCALVKLDSCRSLHNGKTALWPLWNSLDCFVALYILSHCVSVALRHELSCAVAGVVVPPSCAKYKCSNSSRQT
jgi:hypothetical protein